MRVVWSKFYEEDSVNWSKVYKEGWVRTVLTGVRFMRRDG